MGLDGASIVLELSCARLYSIHIRAVFELLDLFWQAVWTATCGVSSTSMPGCGFEAGTVEASKITSAMVTCSQYSSHTLSYTPIMPQNDGDGY